MTITDEMIGQWALYMLFIGLLARSIYVYVRAPKPYTRGLIGLITIIVIAGLYVIGVAILPDSVFIPSYIKGVPPIGLVFAIHYLTLTQEKKRFSTAFFICSLIIIAVTYMLSVIFRS